MFVSSYWHGVYIGYYLCLGSVPFYLPVEDIYDKLFRQQLTGTKKKIATGITWMFRTFAFSYMSLPFIYLYPSKIIKHWGSIYFMGHVVSIIGYFVGLWLKKLYRKSNKDSDSKELHAKDSHHQKAKDE